MHGAHPQLVRGKLEQLHPTQITVGKIEVACKREEWSKLGKKARKAALDSHWFPTILGPNGQHYIVDHHHFGLALIEEGVKEVPLLVLKDMSWLEPEIFMEHDGAQSMDASIRRARHTAQLYGSSGKSDALA
jgi:hypothetical protein